MTASDVRILALGDSLTLGVGDPKPGRPGFEGRLDGWVAHLVSALSNAGRQVSVVNKAFAGAQSSHVVVDQLPRIMGLTADVATCIIGVNDLFRPTFDVDQYRANLETIFSALSIAAPVVITATIHPFDAQYPLPGAMRTKLRAATAEANAVIREMAQRYGLLVLDLEQRPEMQSPDIWAIDRLHPNRYGHQLIAVEVLRLLHEAGHFTDVELPRPTPVGRGANDLAHVVWVGGYVHNVVTSRLRERFASR